MTPGRRITVAATAAAVLAAGCGGGGEKSTTASGGGPQGDGKLPEATTYTTLKGLPQDQAPFKADGTVVRPKAPLPVSAQPGGPALAMLPDKQLGGPTWVPVVESRPGWNRVLLPSRPNRVTGWIPGATDKVETARSTHAVTVDVSDRRLTLTESGRKVGSWTVAVGEAKTPTPTGRTFLLASLAPPKATYSPLILPVGAHSETLDTFGGGPGTVAFHGWPRKDVFGKAVTHGCVRVPADALARLSKAPLGTPVEIVD
ncbi:L,D-transpeptidase [Actinomadura rudentiformis]|uniref:L,D-transpeptidase n=1 Tax=Actinomadura rudentiformis TaxID=359158 RepID=A0A6H9YZB7_9ACTN|nr:L,D-transpeptidase [Actinomadura rudentiformis]KAB2345903.1 L,D-transpeptidase [Actinomadura rudentiformis]